MNPLHSASFHPFPARLRCGPSNKMGWAGNRNGDLLHLAAGRGFQALITVDRGFEYQQNAGDLPIPVIIMLATRNRLPELKPLAPGVVSILSGRLQRRIYRVPT